MGAASEVIKWSAGARTTDLIYATAIYEILAIGALGSAGPVFRPPAAGKTR